MAPRRKAGEQTAGRGRGYRQALPAEERADYEAAARDAELDEEIALIRTKILAILKRGPRLGEDGQPVFEAEAALFRALETLVRLIRLRVQVSRTTVNQLAELAEQMAQERLPLT